jgi:transposase
MHRKFDDSFKIMAVDLSVVKGSVADVAKELDIDPSLLSKWRRNPRDNGNKVLPDNPKISPEEQESRILRKKLRDTELERNILNYRRWGRRMG